MDKWIKKLSGAVIASVLALTLSSKAYAEPNEEDNNLTDNNEPKTEIVDHKQVIANDDSINEASNYAFGKAITDNTNSVNTNAKADNTFNNEKIVTADNKEFIKAINDEGPADADNTDAPDKGNNEVKLLDQVTKEKTPEQKTQIQESEHQESQKQTIKIGDGIVAGDTRDTSSPSITVVDDTIVNGDSSTPGEITTIYPESTELIDVDKIDNDKTGSWGYVIGDTSSPVDDILYMDDFQAESITANDCDLNIKSTGLNQISSINVGAPSANNTLTISGTGIMLVESMCINGNELIPNTFSSETKIDNFFLKPLNDSASGSVAVFLKAGNQAGSINTYNPDSYVLINGNTADGSVTGILDSNYTVPDGINLIVPGGTSIEFICPDSSATLDSEPIESPLTYGLNFNTVSSLTIQENSTLTVNSGATINMSGKIYNNKNGKVGDYNTGEIGVIQAPVLNVQGKITGSGTITGKPYTDEHGDNKIGTGIVLINNEGLNNSNIPSLDDSILHLEIGDLGYIIFSRTNAEMLNYFENYLKNQSIISNEEFDTLTVPDQEHPGSYKWGDVFTSSYAFKFADNTEKYLYSNENQNKINGSDCDFSKLTVFKWCIYDNVGGGGDITLTTTSATGTGKLGLANHSLILKVTDKDTYYNLSAYLDSEQIFKLDKKVTVRFDYPESSEEGQLFAVFRNEDGSLTAFPARYDTVSGELVFSGDKLGNFVVVCINYKDKLYTKEFYDFLETIESVKDLKYGL